MSLQKFGIIAIYLLTLMVGLAGCIASSDTASERSLTEVNQGWNQVLMSNHLSLFNSVATEGRATGTRGFFRTADYVASQLKDFGLQPVLQAENRRQGEYRLQFAMRLWSFDQIRISLVDRDTLNLVQGQDFLAFPPTMNIQSDHRREPLALSRRQERLSAKLQNADSTHVRYSAQTKTLIEEGQYILQQDVRGQEEVTLSAMHVLGMIPGRHIHQRDSLIVVVAPLDGMGIQGLVSFSDGSDLGLAPSALLEVARRVSDRQDKWAFLGPSVLIQFVSGTLQRCQGPSAAFKHLPWDKKYIQKVIVLEETTQSRCDWGQIIENEHISAPFFVYHPQDISLAQEDTTPFYPFVRREKRLRSALMAEMNHATSELATRALDAITAN